MSPRTRGIVAVAIATLVLFALIWLDVGALANARDQASATFRIGNYAWLGALGAVAVAAAAILFAGLAWWSRSLVASVAFVVAGAAGTLAMPLVFGVPGEWPLGLNYALSWWITTTSGPLGAAPTLAAALVVAGVIGLYRWAVTRRLGGS
jgi:hypothetical protein